MVHSKASQSNSTWIDVTGLPAWFSRDRLSCAGGIAEVAHLVEHRPSKSGVAGSSPVFRSTYLIMKVKMLLVDDDDTLIESATIELSDISKEKVFKNENLTEKVLLEMVRSAQSKRSKNPSKQKNN